MGKKIKSILITRDVVFAAAWSFLFAIAQVLGNIMSRRGYLWAGWRDLAVQVVKFAALWAVSTVICVILYDLISRMGTKGCSGRRSKHKISPRMRFTGIFLLLLICWFPILLSYYPGIFAYDASAQLEQFLNHSFSNHHPLLHTLLLGSLFSLGRFGPNYNVGVLVYSVVQMAVLAGAFSYAIYKMAAWGCRKTGILLGVLFYGLWPVNGMMSVSTTKDVLFAGVFIVFVTESMEALSGKAGHAGKLRPALVLSAALCLFMRNNAVYALIPALLLILIVRKKKAWGYAAMTAGGIAIYLAGNSLLMWGLNASEVSPVESLSVPIQQMARTVLYADNLDEDLKEEVYFYIPQDILERYAPNISDAVKNQLDGQKILDEPVRFLKTWIKLGRKEPAKYMEAFLALTQGYYDINDTTHANIYGSGMASRLGYLLTNYKAMPDGYQVEHVSKLPKLEYLLEKLFSDNVCLKIPVLKYLFAPSFSWWFLLFYLGYMGSRKRYADMLWCVFPALYYVTLLLGPVCLIRYVYPLIVCLPLMWGRMGTQGDLEPEG